MQCGLSLTWNIQSHQKTFPSVTEAHSSAPALHVAGRVQYQERRGWGRPHFPVIPGFYGNREKQKYQQEGMHFWSSQPRVDVDVEVKSIHILGRVPSHPPWQQHLSPLLTVCIPACSSTAVWSTAASQNRFRYSSGAAKVNLFCIYCLSLDS